MKTAAKREAGRDLLAAIGDTPLIELSRLPGVPTNTHLFAKLEGCNPGGSIKDRPVARILKEAQAAGRLAAGVRVLDSSSGNAGISYAMLGGAMGLGVSIVVPGNASRERIERMTAHGAELLLTDPLKGYDFALQEARRLAETYPERYWYADQYSNDANWRAHYESTGPEIREQILQKTGAPIDAFVAGVGTGGTLTGVGRRLREGNPKLFIAAVLPERFPGIEGLKPLGEPEDIVPAIFEADLVDEYVPVTVEQALTVTKLLAQCGLFVGPSSGAYVYAATRLAAERKFRCIATVLSDTGERYGSTGLWRGHAGSG